MKTNRPLLALAILLAAMLACNLPIGPGQQSPPPTAAEPVTVIEEPTLVPSVTAVLAPPTATAEPTQTAAPTATIGIVTITASGGNLNVRRGPGVAYNPITFFTDGQTAVVVARNADGSWLNITLPDGSGLGWVNAGTRFSLVTGTINFLPVATVDLPAPAYIRNCTFHEMRVKPADVIVPIQTDPSSRLQFNPGSYDIVDVTTGKTVRSLNLREGDSVDITKDGLGNLYACP